MSRDLGHMLAVLRGVLPNGVRITGITPLTTGFSNDTYILDGADLILRLPPHAGAMLDGHGVMAQARIYQELAAVADGPMVPKIAYISEDDALLGVPFFAMERVAGASIHDMELAPWFINGDADLRCKTCEKWITAFAGLANMQPLNFLGDVVSPEDDARMWQRFGAQADCPELVTLFDRLLGVAAPISGPPAIVHGDTKLSNLMWDNGEISAVLDWEMALNGEPLADLGYVLYGFASPYHAETTPARQSGMLNRAEVIALWEQVSGRSAEGVLWHEIAQIGKLCAIIAEGSNLYITGRSSDPKLAFFLKNRDYYLGVMRAMLDGGGF